MATVNEEFQSAPLGGCVLRQAVGGFVAMLFAFAVGITVAFTMHHGRAMSFDWYAVIFGPLFGFLISVPSLLRERAKVARFRIEEDCLVLGKERYPLKGVVDIARDPEVMRGARKVFGGRVMAGPRGRTGIFRGYCKSKRMGKFYRFLTNPEKAVVLRWPDNVVAVSPADPEFFMLMSRKAAGLQ